MAWDDIVESERFKALPYETKKQVADNYFQKNFASSEKFTGLPTEVQEKTKANFFKTIGPEPPVAFTDRISKLSTSGMFGGSEVAPKGTAAPEVGSMADSYGESDIKSKAAPIDFLNEVGRTSKMFATGTAKALNEGMASIASVLDSGADAISKLTGLSKGGLFEKAKKEYLENAEAYGINFEQSKPDAIAKFFTKFAGGLVPGVASWEMGVPFAAKEGWDAAEKAGGNPYTGAAQAALERILTGGVFHATAGLSRPVRSAVLGGVMGGEAATKGESIPEGIATGVGLGAMGGPGAKTNWADKIQAIKERYKKPVEEAPVEAAPTAKEAPIPTKEPTKTVTPTKEAAIDEAVPVSDRRGHTPDDELLREKLKRYSTEAIHNMLLTDKATGAKTRLAYEMVAEERPDDQIGISDAKGLGAIDAHLGHKAGDDFVSAVVQAHKDAGVPVYRASEKGDEFLTRWPKDTPKEEINAALEGVNDRLRDSVLVVENPDGSRKYFTNLEFYIATGRDYNEAGYNLGEVKRTKQPKGYVKGEFPRHLVELTEEQFLAKTRGKGFSDVSAEKPKGAVEEKPQAEPIEAKQPAKPEEPAVAETKAKPRTEPGLDELLADFPSEEELALEQEVVSGLRPAIKSAEKVESGRSGGSHAETITGKNIQDVERGFTTPDGEFLDRKDAKEWVAKNEPAVAAELPEGEMHSEPYAQARLKAEERVTGKEKTIGEEVNEVRKRMGLSPIEAKRAAEAEEVPSAGRKFIEPKGVGTPDVEKPVEALSAELEDVVKKMQGLRKKLTEVEEDEPGKADEIYDSLELLESRASAIRKAGEGKPGFISRILGSERGAAGESEPAATFYSQLERVIEDKIPGKATPDVISKIVNNPQNAIKKDELKWTGLEEWLKEQKGPVTKQQVLDFVRQGRVQIQEVVKGEPTKITPAQKAVLDSISQLKDQRDQGLITFVELGRERDRILKSAGMTYDEYYKLTEPTTAKFSQYKTPGGANYKEVLFRIPIETTMSKEEPYTYGSPHWEERNVLAHARTQDFVDSEGKKVLLVEEVQSDWAQEGRKGKDVPPMPFFKNWHELVMKRMLRYAADNGYDKVAWTTGEQQAERYDLSKQINSVHVAKDASRKDYSIAYEDKYGEYHEGGYATADKLEGIVGKDLAKKIVSDIPDEGRKSYSGLDLKVGGEGMKGFYDKIIPDFMRSYTKKWGGEVKDSTINYLGTAGPVADKTGEFKVHSVAITPAMKSAVVYKGQTLYGGLGFLDPAALSGHLKTLNKDIFDPIKNAWSTLPETTEIKETVGKYMEESQIYQKKLSDFLTTFDKQFSPEKQRAMARALEADMDAGQLTRWKDLTKDETLKKVYDDASKLRPEEQEVVRQVRVAFDDGWKEATDAGILDDDAWIENYFAHLGIERDKGGAEKAELRALVNAGVLRQKPSFAKRRLFKTLFDLEQAGYRQKKGADQIGFGLTSWLQSLAEAKAARETVKQISKSRMFEKEAIGAKLSEDVVDADKKVLYKKGTEVTEKVAKDLFDKKFNKVATEKGDRYISRPAIAIGGHAQVLEAEAWEKHPAKILVRPNATKKDLVGYRRLEHPALQHWKWIGNSPIDGTPVIMEGPMLVHKDAYPQLNALLGRSWFRDYKVGSDVPVIGGTAPFRGLLKAQTFIKGTTLIGPFHHVTIGEHALFHGVNPLKTYDLNLEGIEERKLLRSGLMVFNKNALAEYGEGAHSGGLPHWLGNVIKEAGQKLPEESMLRQATDKADFLESYGEFLFQRYIPGLKMEMAKAAVERAKKWYAEDLKSGKITEKQIYENVARQSNAAFGEQNYKYMGRNPTLQDGFRLAFLAPDFLESRLRFGAQALKPYGREQQKALVMGMIYTALLTQTLNTVFGDKKKPNWEKPFSFTIGGKDYSPRSVVADAWHLATDWKGFVNYRLGPIDRAFLEWWSGRDVQGRKVEPNEVLKDIAKGWTPIPMQSFIKAPIGTSRPMMLLDSILQSSGITSYKSLDAGEKLLYDSRPKRDYTPDQKERMAKIGELKGKVKSGAISMDDVPDEAEKSGVVLGSKDLENIAGAQLTGDELKEYQAKRALAGVTIQDAMRAYRKMGKENKDLYRDGILKKLAGSRSLTVDEKEKLYDELTSE